MRLKNVTKAVSFYVSFLFLKDCIYLLLERGREGEREGEKHRCVVASLAAPTPQCTCPGSPTSDPSVHRLALSPLSHTSQGSFYVFFDKETMTLEDFTKQRGLHWG